MIKLLHFADAHIDMANYGKHDPQTGLPMRVMDFLKSLDEIVDTAIEEMVDMVIFAGDAYKDRSPAPTYQREWGKRIMRLSHAGILTLLLTGNHDISPATGRAHAIQEFDTLEVPHVRVLNKPTLLLPTDLEDLPIQIIAIPWITKSLIIQNSDIQSNNPSEINLIVQSKLINRFEEWIRQTDPKTPLILTAHASAEGADYGYERLINISKDFVLPPDIIKNENLDYVALGHIHKPQELLKDYYPPIIYPGSIERVDFGEEKEKKYFIIANIEKRNTKVEWRELKNIRPFISKYIKLENEKDVNKRLLNAMPSSNELKDAIARLIITYKRELEPLIDEMALYAKAEQAFEFQLIKRPLREARARIPDGKAASSLGLIELLDIYWDATSKDMGDNKKEALNQLAQSLINDIE
jgi:DNA repair protein SbcD/Mre11